MGETNTHGQICACLMLHLLWTADPRCDWTQQHNFRFRVYFPFVPTSCSVGKANTIKMKETITKTGSLAMLVTRNQSIYQIKSKHLPALSLFISFLVWCFFSSVTQMRGDETTGKLQGRAQHAHFAAERLWKPLATQRRMQRTCHSTCPAPLQSIMLHLG